MTECTEDSRRCTKCGFVKPLSDFRRKNDTKSGRASRCKACLREIEKQKKPSAADRIGGRRDYVIRKDDRGDGVVRVKFGDKRDNKSFDPPRKSASTGTQSSLQMFDNS